MSLLVCRVGRPVGRFSLVRRDKAIATIIPAPPCQTPDGPLRCALARPLPPTPSPLCTCVMCVCCVPFSRGVCCIYPFHGLCVYLCHTACTYLNVVCLSVCVFSRCVFSLFTWWVYASMVCAAYLFSCGFACTFCHTACFLCVCFSRRVCIFSSG